MQNQYIAWVNILLQYGNKLDFKIQVLIRSAHFLTTCEEDFLWIWNLFLLDKIIVLRNFGVSYLMCCASSLTKHFSYNVLLCYLFETASNGIYINATKYVKLITKKIASVLPWLFYYNVKSNAHWFVQHHATHVTQLAYCCSVQKYEIYLNLIIISQVFAQILFIISYFEYRLSKN